MVSTRSRRLTRPQARRVALTAQGLAASRPEATPHLGHVLRTVRRLGVLQIDSVNVVERAHHLTLFSRLGAHDPDLLWRALQERRVFEYWARMASFAPIEHFPLFRYRMATMGRGPWKKLEKLGRASEYVEEVYRQVAERGPLTTSDLDEPGERSGPWWGWADGKIALEYLFAVGRVTVAHRRNFTRYYDITERVIPTHLLNGSQPSLEQAHRELLVHAARALGVGTARDIVGYYRLPADAIPLLDGLVADGDLERVEVEGWKEPAWMWAGTAVPRRTSARTLLNPFDTHMFNRDRLKRLHGFQYRIEIYVPAPKRTYGYYVFAFLLGDDIVARIDLKADREAGVLRVPGAFLEEGRDADCVAPELVAELAEMAAWLGLGDIEVGGNGDLSPVLRRHL